MKTSWLVLLVGCVVHLLGACASVPKQDITAVPKIETNRLSAPQLAFLKSHDIRIVVSDQRAPEYHVNSDATVAEVTRALSEVFTHQGFAISPAATQLVSIEIQDDVDETAPRVNGVAKKSYCVKLSGNLQLGEKRFVNAKATSCHPIHDSLGIQQGGDISRAYEKALNLIFEKWDNLGNETFGRI